MSLIIGIITHYKCFLRLFNTPDQSTGDETEITKNFNFGAKTHISPLKKT